MDHRYRACPLCEAICGLEFRYQKNQLTAIHGDNADTFSRGHICPKGNAILDLEADPDRIRVPMKRVGEQWFEATWDEAFFDISEKLHAIQTQFGKSAVALYFGNPNAHHFTLAAYLPFFVRAIGSRNVYSASSVDQWPHQLANWQMYGHQWLLPIPDLDQLDTLLILGANPVASNGSLMTAPDVNKRLQAIRARGDLIVLDPRKTETAEIASLYFPIKPSTDCIFMLALLQALQKFGAAKVAVYEQKINGLDAVLERVNSIEVTNLIASTGMTLFDVELVAEKLYRAKHCAVYGRMGVSTQRFGSVTQYLIQICNIFLGQLDQIGGCLPNEPIFPITGPGTSKGSHGRWVSRVRGLPEVSGELPVAVLREEIETEGDGKIRALLTIAGNPVLSTPDGASLDRALTKLDFQVAIDIYLNETTRHANWILPPASFLSEEHYDVFFNAFAIRKVARLNLPIEPAAPNSLSHWKILQQCIQGLNRIRNEPQLNIPNPLELLEMGLQKGGSGISLQALREAPHGLNLGPLQPSLMRRLETTSGMIECAPPMLMRLLSEAVEELLAKPAVEKNSLQLIGRRHVRSNNSWMHNAPRLIKGKPRHQLLMHPSDMQVRGIIDGARVRIESITRVIEIEAVASESMMQGVVSLPHGFGHHAKGGSLSQANTLRGASINDLTCVTELDSGTGNAAFSSNMVQVSII